MGNRSYAGSRTALELDGAPMGFSKTGPGITSSSGKPQRRRQVVMKLDIAHRNLKNAIIRDDLPSAKSAAAEYFKLITGG